jgi:hypothetical protein
MPRLKSRQKQESRREQVASLIQVLGGTSALARLVDVVPSAVSNWRRLGRFPARLYLQMRDELADRGVFAERHLWGMSGDP